MDSLTSLWPLPLGFIAGIVAVPALFRWLLLLLASLGKLPRDLGTDQQRPRKSGMRLAVFHPVPWLLVLGLALGVPQLLTSSARAEWLWFVAGAVAAPVLNGVLVYRAVRRARAKRRPDASI